ncbi:MAG: aldehyde dehydrogenase family protein [Ignavibacteria bacterium]|nr:aldehyde dehydrogenase family protein [Ignavibacteria bacterium]
MPARLQVPKMYKLFIGGKFVRTESERYTSVKDIISGNKVCNISKASRKDIRNAVVASRAGFNVWSAKTGYERGLILYRLAEMLEGRKEQFALEISVTSGKTKKQSLKEVMKSVDRLVWYSGLADKHGQLTGSVNDVQNGYFNFSISEPTGVVGILLPESMPLLALITRICAVISSGNSSIIIPSETSPLAALTFSEICATSDVPAGVINILTGSKKELIPHLASHMDVNAFDFAENNTEFKKLVQNLCANNVKRFIYSALNDQQNYFNDEINENLQQVQSFTELKTVWHTMGL